TARDVVTAAGKQLSGAQALAKSGALTKRPDLLVRTALIARRWGATVAAGVVMNALRHPGEIAFGDERGALTWAELDRRSNLLAWTDSDDIDGDTLDAVIAAGGDDSLLSPPQRPGRTVILTSGTTGTPKGAQRDAPSNPLAEVSAALSRIPLRAREPIVVAPP